MNPLSARIAQEYAGMPPSGPAQRAAIEALLRTGLPATRDENWKYANLRALERQRFVPAPAKSPTLLPASVPAALPDHVRFVFVDGVLAPQLSAPLTAAGAVVTLEQRAIASARTPGPDERFALLNRAFAPAPVNIRVPAAGAAGAIELLFLASCGAEHGASYPRLSLELAAGASLSLIERHASATEHGNFVVSAVDVALGRGAQLQHYRLQELNARSTLFDTLAAQLAAQAGYRLYAVASGAQAARSTLTLRHVGEQAELALALVALGTRAQVQDTYALIEHVAPQARTTQTFRGIAAGRSRVACNGKIVVARGAHGSDSRQSLRGLLAGAEAEIDVRPQLEIYTDDVRCSHGATAGKLDDDALFYLLSRGLTPDAAQRLLKWAFLEDVIAQIELPGLRRQIEERLAAQLGDDTVRALL
jgi:Fe-S cluster assembly protein SufD